MSEFIPDILKLKSPVIPDVSTLIITSVCPPEHILLLFGFIDIVNPTIWPIIEKLFFDTSKNTFPFPFTITLASFVFTPGTLTVARPLFKTLSANIIG